MVLAMAEELDIVVQMVHQSHAHRLCLYHAAGLLPPGCGFDVVVSGFGSDDDGGVVVG